jgi:PleD family two-component response regulator
LERERTSSELPADEPSKRILIVDDDITNGPALLSVLAKHGFEAWLESDPFRARERAQAARADLILLRFEISKMLGSELAVILKSNPDTRGVPIMFVSGIADEAIMTIAATSGGASFVTLPVDEAKLIRDIRDLLRHPR